jgi:regulator of replication initiation timing
MSEDKHFENDPERTLITLEQLSQTIEVMTSVVNRLRQHLSEQLHAQMEEQNLKLEQAKAGVVSASETEATASVEASTQQTSAQRPSVPKKESFVVEIRQQDSYPTGKPSKILH